MMRSQPPPGREVPSPQRRRTPEDQPASIPAATALPGWDSFATADRRLLIDLLVQTACRQIRVRPLPHLDRDRG